MAGLFRDQADIDSSAIHDFVQASDKVTRPGQVKIADLDGNGFIDPGNFAVDDHGDLRIIGNQSPRYRYGVNLSARWNGIGLSVFLQGVGARDWYPGSDAGMFWGKYGRPFFALIPSIHNYTDDMYSAERNNWDTAYWPRMTTYQSNGTKNWTRLLEIPNTRYIQSAAYLRVKNIQLDYSFPEAHLFGHSAARAENLRERRKSLHLHAAAQVRSQLRSRRAVLRLGLRIRSGRIHLSDPEKRDRRGQHHILTQGGLYNEKPYRNSDRCAGSLFVRRLSDAGEPQ
ncbi:MAG: hypothetical protein ACLSHL_01085 [Alistipes communis]